MPAPHRDAHGRRLYSDRDVAAIRRLMDLVGQGLTIGRAVALLREGGGAAVGEWPSPRVDRLRLQLLQAIDWMDDKEVTTILSEAEQAATPEVVVLELMQPVLYGIGELWEKGCFSVASEHFGTHILRSFLTECLRHAPEAWRPHHILVGCAPTELHDVGALVVALFLRRAGFRVTYLGANLDAESLLAALERVRPAALCLSATTSRAAGELATLYRDLKDTFGAVPAYGGRAFDEEADRTLDLPPGLNLGSDVVRAVDILVAELDGGKDVRRGRDDRAATLDSPMPRP